MCTDNRRWSLRRKRVKITAFLFGLIVWAALAGLAELGVVSWGSVTWIGLVCSVPLWVIA
jgi:hypothetical protein